MFAAKQVHRISLGPDMLLGSHCIAAWLVFDQPERAAVLIGQPIPRKGHLADLAQKLVLSTPD